MPTVNEADVANFLAELPLGLLECMMSTDEVNAEYPEDPASFKDAMASPDANKWLAACWEELNSIKSLDVYDLVLHSEATNTGQRILKGKFVFRVKHDENGVPMHWKVHFVAKGYEAVYGVDYQKTTSPMM